MAKVYFGLGSNVGNRQKFLNDALNGLKKQVSNLKISSFYQTEPWGNTDQPVYLNVCASGVTALHPLQLLDFIKSIEKKLGRVHTEKWGPREIDIDILFYGGQIFKSPELEIPHPAVVERAFVLIPLAELAPGFVHPGLKKTISELAEAIGSEGVEKAPL